MKIWISKIGDSKPSIITKDTVNRPSEISITVPDGTMNIDNYTVTWSGNTPVITEVVGWQTAELAARKVMKLETDLLLTDKEVQEADNQPFSFNGNLYYPDTEFIQGIFSVLPLLPSNYTEEWKTAEKDTDGVKNKKVTLNKTGIQGLALAYLQFKKDNWKAGELKKDALKEAFLAGE